MVQVSPITIGMIVGAALLAGFFLGWLLGFVYGLTRGRKHGASSRIDPPVPWPRPEKKEHVEPDPRSYHVGNNFVDAGTLAAKHGMKLIRHCDTHYALETTNPRWRYNLYPSNGRIWPDPHYKGPFLRVKRPWTFADVVQAAIDARAAMKS